MKLYVQRLSPDEPFTAPSKAYPDDVGLDLYCSRHAVVRPGCFGTLHTNTAIAPERGGWVWLTDRSSTFYKRHLLCHQGKVDPGYRGELAMMVYNPTSKSVSVRVGDRLFQMVVNPDPLKVEVVMIGKLPGSERGTGGIGSSGR